MKKGGAAWSPPSPVLQWLHHWYSGIFHHSWAFSPRWGKCYIHALFFFFKILATGEDVLSGALCLRCKRQPWLLHLCRQRQSRAYKCGCCWNCSACAGREAGAALSASAAAAAARSARSGGEMCICPFSVLRNRSCRWLPCYCHNESQLSRKAGKYVQASSLLWNWKLWMNNWCVCALSLSNVWFFVIPLRVAHQAPLAMGFPRQEYWRGLPFPSPGDLPDPGIEPKSPASAGGFFSTEPLITREMQSKVWWEITSYWSEQPSSRCLQISHLVHSRPSINHYSPTFKKSTNKCWRECGEKEIPFHPYTVAGNVS